MRIAWVVPGFQGREDEPGIPALTALAHALADQHELEVFSVRFPPRAERYRLGAVTVRGFGGTAWEGRPWARRPASAWRWVRVLRAIALAHRRAPFDVIHGWWATESGMLAALEARMLGLPALVSLAGGELAGVGIIGYGGRTRALQWAQILLALHLATAIGVPSGDARRRLLLRAPWLRQRLRAIPLGYDPAIFTPSPIGAPDHAPPRSATAPADEDSHPRTSVLPAISVPPCLRGERTSLPEILCVASWAPVKGHDLLLNAAALLQARGVPFHLSLVGERTESAAAHAAVAARGLEGRVSLLGARSQRGVAALLGEAAVLAQASWHEAQCLAVVEALACGVPVVATPAGIARELLGDPAIGRCIERRSPALLADALQAQVLRPRDDEPRAQQIRHAAVAHLALPAVAERLLAAYAALVAAPQGPA